MYPIQSPDQLAAYLRALRKAQGLTQARLGVMLGVTRTRVGEIEKDPSNVGFAQLQRIFHLLGARFVLDDRGAPVRTLPTPVPSPSRGEW